MKVKYMGSADVRLIEAGEDFAGRLATPVATTVIFNKDNDWVVDTDDTDLSGEAVEFLLEKDQGFLDVTGLERVPVNLVQSTYYGLKDLTEEAAVEVTPNPTPNGGRITTPENQDTVAP